MTEILDALWNLQGFALMVACFFTGAFMGIAFMFKNWKADTQKAWVDAFEWATGVLCQRRRDCDIYLALCKAGLAEKDPRPTVQRLYHWLKIERENLKLHPNWEIQK